ncbi:MAG: TetR/AcrR family transcriptional regulator [Pseudomonadota bacterium]
MNKPIQARTLKTRAKLIDAAKAVVATSGYESLRVEEVVQRAGVAKGTFFAHFRDKDALMDQLLGAEMDGIFDALDAAPVPDTPEAMADALAPLITFMTSERYVFDVILRYSGAAGVTEIGPIARTFERQFRLFAKWTAQRSDLPPELLAEGIQAFLIQAMSLQFCALHASSQAQDRLVTYLHAWLR